MTYQIRDQIHWDDELWQLETGAWANGQDAALWDPAEHGLHSKSFISTACYHGYHCTFAVREAILVLSELVMGRGDSMPALYGREPVPVDSEPDLVGGRRSCGDWWYRDLDRALDFSGGLILGRERAPRPCSLGPELPWRYAHLVELIFEDGRLVESLDHSEAMQTVRDWVASNDGKVPLPDGQDPSLRNVILRYDVLNDRIQSHFRFRY